MHLTMKDANRSITSTDNFITHYADVERDTLTNNTTIQQDTESVGLFVLLQGHTCGVASAIA